MQGRLIQLTGQHRSQAIQRDVEARECLLAGHAETAENGDPVAMRARAASRDERKKSVSGLASDAASPGRAPSNLRILAKLSLRDRARAVILACETGLVAHLDTAAHRQRHRGDAHVYAFGLPADAGVDAVFTIGTRPLVSRPLLSALLRSNT